LGKQISDRHHCPQGRVLRVFDKKSPHLRYVPGSIFSQKALRPSMALSGERLIKKPLDALADGDL